MGRQHFSNPGEIAQPIRVKGTDMKPHTFAKLLGAAIALAAVVPTASADPVCAAGFQTVEKKNWILKCRKTVPMAQKGVALTQAQTAQCKVNSYWNFGPSVTANHGPANVLVTVRYTCGHVAG
jgi:hypothetical protein